MNIHYLDKAIQVVCPIRGVASNRVIDFSPEATAPQKAAAQAIADGWDFDVPSAAEAADIAAAQALTQCLEIAKADTVVQYLRDHTTAECEAYVQANVTDLASARQMLKKFAVALCILAKQNLR